MFKVNKNPKDAELRRFGRAMLLGFGAIGVVLWALSWWRHGGDGPFAWSGGAGQIASVCAWTLGASLGALSLLSSRSARRIYVVWMTVTFAVGTVTSTMLLTVVFLSLLPLCSLVVRRSDPLRKKSGGATYWEDYPPYEHTLERMRRLF